MGIITRKREMIIGESIKQQTIIIDETNITTIIKSKVDII